MGGDTSLIYVVVGTNRNVGCCGRAVANGLPLPCHRLPLPSYPMPFPSRRGHRRGYAKSNQIQPNPTKFSPDLSSKSQVISSAPSPAQPTRAKKGLHQHAANPPSPPVPPANPPGHHGRAVTSDHHFVDHNPTVRRGPQPLLPLFVPCLQSVEPRPASRLRICRVSDLTRAPSLPRSASKPQILRQTRYSFWARPSAFRSL